MPGLVTRDNKKSFWDIDYPLSPTLLRGELGEGRVWEGLWERGSRTTRQLTCKHGSPHQQASGFSVSSTTGPIAQMEEPGWRVKMACSKITQPESGEGDSTQAF